MEQLNQSGGIVLLFDTYSTESRNLYESFQNAGIEVSAAVIEDDGFLPEGLISVYGYFLGDFSRAAKAAGRPLYFNELQIPDFWEIESTNASGKVMNYNRERARIYYAEPANKRLIKLVDWIDENGTVRLCEHYNKYGALYCRTTFNKKGEKVSRNFFSAEGKEVIVENFITSDIIVTMDGKDRILHGKREFIRFFLRASGLERRRLFFNSLSFPFFASLDLPDNGKKDILFWEEEIYDGIPGNMQMILNQGAPRTKLIYVQKHEAYEKLIKLGASEEMVKELGYVYSFARENQGNREALICTNSDQIERLTELVEALPELHFHIAALTEMSQRLHDFEKYKNVSLYPGVKLSVLDKLFARCDYYFDNNHEAEIVDAVHRAFLNRMLIFGVKEYVHNRNYIAKEHIFESGQIGGLIEAVKLALESPEKRKEALRRQEETALSLDREAFLAVLGR